MIFAPERMIRMDVLTLPGEARTLTGLLAREGSLHLVERELPARDGRDDKGGGAQPPSLRESINRAGNLIDSLLQRLEISPLEPEGDLAGAACLERGAEELLADAESSLNALRLEIDAHFEEREKAESAIDRLNELSELMHLLNDHGLSFLDVRRFVHFHAVCGTVDRTHIARLTQQLADLPCALALRPAHVRGSAFLLIGDRERAGELDAALKDAGARVVTPPEKLIRPTEEGFEQIEIELWAQRERLAELNGILVRARAEWHKSLSEWKHRLRVQGLLDDAMRRFTSDGVVTLISGYVPASRRDALVRRLEREAAGRYYARFEAARSGAELPPPTRLLNAKLFRPFEMFVKTYGLPGYNDIDPTPFVAISFLAMFGMMFGDVGHGLVLAAFGACMAWLPYRLFLPIRDLGRILTMAGLSGTLFGFLFGSVFGVEEDSVLPAIWLRPSHPENLTTFLGAALALGVVILSTGIILNIVQAWRRRDLRKALIGQWSASSLVFFWALLLIFGLRMMGKEIPIPAGGLVVILAVPLCLVAGGQLAFFVLAHRRRGADAAAAETLAGSGDGPDEHGAGAAEEGEDEELATILFEPIEIVMNLFTNSVSFLRVAAFGLAHAALTMAVFIVNDMVRVPGANLLSLPFEHLFIIVLEGMIVTIQCLRLEYYEFFSKFFGGNGVAYAPLSIGTDGSTDEEVSA